MKILVALIALTQLFATSTSNNQNIEQPLTEEKSKTLLGESSKAADELVDNWRLNKLQNDDDLNYLENVSLNTTIKLKHLIANHLSDFDSLELLNKSNENEDSKYFVDFDVLKSLIYVYQKANHIVNGTVYDGNVTFSGDVDTNNLVKNMTQPLDESIGTEVKNSSDIEIQSRFLFPPRINRRRCFGRCNHGSLATGPFNNMFDCIDCREEQQFEDERVKTIDGGKSVVILPGDENGVFRPTDDVNRPPLSIKVFPNNVKNFPPYTIVDDDDYNNFETTKRNVYNINNNYNRNKYHVGDNKRKYHINEFQTNGRRGMYDGEVIDLSYESKSREFDSSKEYIKTVYKYPQPPYKYDNKQPGFGNNDVGNIEWVLGGGSTEEGGGGIEITNEHIYNDQVKCYQPHCRGRFDDRRGNHEYQINYHEEDKTDYKNVMKVPHKYPYGNNVINPFFVNQNSVFRKTNDEYRL